MSQENVEIVRQMLAAYNAGDLELALSFCARDVEVIPDASVFPEAESRNGRQGFRGFMVEINAAWMNPSYGTSEVFTANDGRVVHRGEWGGEGASSGAKLTTSITGVYSIRENEISRVVFFFDHAEALKAVGLEE